MGDGPVRMNSGSRRQSGDGSFSDEERKYIKRLFVAFDTNRSGTIDFIEFKILARKLGVEMNDEELRRSLVSIGVESEVPEEMELDFKSFLGWLEGAQGEGGDPFSRLKAKIKAQGLKPPPNSQIEGLRECFSHFDADGSGAIDVQELGSVFHAFGQELPEQELTAMIRDVSNQPDSSVIEFEDFLMLMIQTFGDADSAEHEVQAEFEKHDPENTGVLSVAKVRAIIKELCGEVLGDDEIIEIVAAADERSTGKVEYMKWESLWEALRE